MGHHKSMTEAPQLPREIAEEMHQSLSGVLLSGIETRYTAVAAVIAKPGKDTKEACLSALGIKKAIDDNHPVWSLATLEEKDWSALLETGFCEYAGCVSEADTSKEDIKKVQATTKIMAEKLTG